MVYGIWATSSSAGETPLFFRSFLGLHGPVFGFLAQGMGKEIAQAQTGAFTARFYEKIKKGLAICPALV